MDWSEVLSWRFTLDVIVLSAITFFAYHSIRSMGTWKVAAGVILAGLFFVSSSLLGLSGVEWLFAQFSPVAVLALVVIFQPEIRRVLERFTSLGFERRAKDQTLPDMIGRTLIELTQKKWGALVVFTGRGPVGQWTKDSKALDAVPSRPLILSLFDPNSPGHDGAIVLEKGRVSHFAAKLPLSTSGRLSPELGTRHSAAMGLSERADCLVIAVSEERGAVTAFADGAVKVLRDSDEISREIQEHIEGTVEKADIRDRVRAKKVLLLEVAASITVVLIIRLLLATRGA